MPDPDARFHRAPGAVFGGRFELVSRLGEGGFGEVWKGYDLKRAPTDKPENRVIVAVKFYRSTSRSEMKFILNEVNRSLELSHPKIVRANDLHVDAAVLEVILSMEFIDGDTLEDLRSDRPGHAFDPEGILPWTRQLCGALEYLHSELKVIVHRDLKPSNLMVDGAGTLKVADFGIARRVREHAEASGLLTRDIRADTPAYSSPQQQNRMPPVVGDDIFSLGATLYCLLAGVPPFHPNHSVEAKLSLPAPPAG